MLAAVLQLAAQRWVRCVAFGFVIFGTQIALADSDRASSIGIAAGPRFGVGTTDFTRFDASFAHDLWQRLHLAVNLSTARAGSASSEATRSVQATIEAGVLVEPSSSVRLLFAWRLGRSRFALDNMRISATVVEFSPELRFRASTRLELRVVPMALAGYWSGIWALMYGPEVGVVVRF